MAETADLRFTESHEWFRADGEIITMGISRFAADELTDITYVDVKRVGAAVEAGQSVGEVESVKTTSDVYTAVSGEVVEVNQAVLDDPSLINSDSFGEGWLIRIRTADASPLNALMTADEYHKRYPTDL
ncbi:MAG: glycine cleavage system protein GcvH [Phycisphaerales bacterium]